MVTMMPYRLSYPLYLDVSDHKQHQYNTNHHSSVTNRNFQYQREDTESPPAPLMNLNALYDSVLVSGHALAFLNGRSHGQTLPLHQYLNSQHFNGKKITSDAKSSKSSFSIEAILGLNAHRGRNNNYLLVNNDSEHEFDVIKSTNNESTKIGDDIIEKGCNYLKTSHSISSVSPDSTAKEQTIDKHHTHTTKGKSLYANSSVAITSNVSHKRDISGVDNSDNQMIMSSNKYSKTSHKIDIHQRQTHNNSNNNQGKSKRVRTIFTPEQLERLETEFERQQYMVGPERLYLASALNLTEAQVKVWFQNRRIKHRKQFFEKEQALIAQLRNRSDDSGEITTDEDGNHDEEASIDDITSDESPTLSNDLPINAMRESPSSFPILSHN